MRKAYTYIAVLSPPVNVNNEIDKTKTLSLPNFECEVLMND